MADTDPSSWEQPFMDPDWRETVVRAAAAHPSPSPQERAAAAAVVAPFLEFGQARFEESPAEIVATVLEGFLVLLAMFILPVAVLGLVSAAVFHGGLLLRLVGVGVVTRSGAEVTRARAFSRAAVSWALIFPMGLATWLPVVAEVRGGTGDLEFHWWLVAPFIIWLAGVVWVAYDPQRGPQDRLTGTYLVPR